MATKKWPPMLQSSRTEALSQDAVIPRPLITSDTSAFEDASFLSLPEQFYIWNLFFACMLELVMVIYRETTDL